jgi:hypothetical protein
VAVAGSPSPRNRKAHVAPSHQIKQRRFAWPAYPALFGAAFVLAAYVSNDISFWGLPRPLMATVAIVTAIQAALSVPLGLHRAALGALGLTVLLFLRTPALVAAGIGATVAIVLGLYLWNRRRGLASPSAVTRAGNSLSVFLLIGLTVVGISNGALPRTIEDLRPRAAAAQSWAPDSLPDIFIILLDANPRADVLQDLFGFDNSAFLAELEEDGFDVHEHSRSNYMYTSQTLASMFQMRHLPEFQSAPGAPMSTRRLINTNPVFDLLRREGYGIQANVAPWDGVVIRGADRLCGDGGLTEFEALLLNSTLLGGAITFAVPQLFPLGIVHIPPPRSIASRPRRPRLRNVHGLSSPMFRPRICQSSSMPTERPGHSATRWEIAI